MAPVEPISLSLGVVALVSLFQTCLEFFELVELGTKFSRDLEILMMKLESQRLIFSIWGHSVGLAGDGANFNDRILGPDVQRTISGLLNCIRLLFEDTERLKKRYGLAPGKKSKAQHRALKAISNIDTSPWARFRGHLVLRQQQTTMITKARWAIFDRAKFGNLLADLKDLIDQLRDITASVTDLDKQRNVFVGKISSISEVHSLELLEEALKDDDPELSDVASQRIIQLTDGSARVTMDLDGSSQSAYVTAPSMGSWDVGDILPNLDHSLNTALLPDMPDIDLEGSVSSQNTFMYGYQNNLGNIQQQNIIKIQRAASHPQALREKDGSSRRRLSLRRIFHEGEFRVYKH